MNISWFKNAEGAITEDLLDVSTPIALTVTSSDDAAYVDMWIQNNGEENGINSGLVDFGIYIEGKLLKDSESILKLGSTKDLDDKAYGVYLLFGYTGTTLGTSVIENWETLSAVELSPFHVNWSRGTSILSKIKLNSIYTFNGNNYIVRNTLGVNEGSLNDYSEGKGRLKVRLLVRAPMGASTFLSDLVLSAHAIAEV
jgi:hypothetical protein